MTHLSVSKLHDSAINFYICLLHTRAGVFTSGPSRAADILTSAQKHKVICYLRVQAAVQVSVGQIKPLFQHKEKPPESPCLLLSWASAGASLS